MVLVGAVLALVAYFKWPKWFWPGVAFAGFFAVASLLKPRFLEPMARAWMTFALVLARVINPLLMLVLFVGLITPIGLLKRLASGNALALKFDKARASYWQRRSDGKPTRESFERQY
jgi:integral membrane sensor domain MASE1